jgi:hypothetical protein
MGTTGRGQQFCKKLAPLRTARRDVTHLLVSPGVGDEDPVNVGIGSMLSKKSFLAGARNFSAPLARPTRDDVRDTLPAEVCERISRDGGSVFPAHANTGDPNGPLRPVR